ncbi:hypothetical protein BGZ89_005366 [Linnemannia elongata]|nr:hypothetical protein BGZ89_005366 [Linnemannia elongata]
MSGPYNRLRKAVIDARIARYTTPTELIRKYYKSFGSGNAGQDKPSTVMKHCEAARVSISEWFLHLCNTDAPK